MPPSVEAKVVKESRSILSSIMGPAAELLSSKSTLLFVLSVESSLGTYNIEVGSLARK